MAQSLLAPFRSREGHSLARALACLLLVNVVVAGFNAGMTPGQTGSVICTTAAGGPGGADGPTTPPTDRDHACCQLGCVTAPVLLTPTPLDLPMPAVAANDGPPTATPTAFAAGAYSPAHRPRGPPVLA